MQLYVDMAEDASKYKENSINIQYKKKKPIFLGPIISNDSLDEAAISFYNFAAENGIDIGYPLGVIINKKDIENKNPFCFNTSLILIYFTFFNLIYNTFNSFLP